MGSKRGEERVNQKDRQSCADYCCQKCLEKSLRKFVTCVTNYNLRPRLYRCFILPKCILLLKSELAASTMKIYVHGFSWKRNRNSDYWRKCDNPAHTSGGGYIALPGGSLPSAAVRPTSSLEAFERHLCLRLLYNIFPSPVTVAFFSHFLQFSTYRLCIPEMPYTVFLKHQTFLSPDCGLTMFLQHSPFSCVENNWNHSSRPSSNNTAQKRLPNSTAHWIIFKTVNTILAHLGYILFSEAPQGSR